MRFIVMAFASIAALGLALPVTAASAQERTVVIKRDRDHDRGVHRYRHYDRGLHRGWSRGHHYGWRNHRAEKVVIIKKRRHHHFD